MKEWTLKLTTERDKKPTRRPGEREEEREEGRKKGRSADRLKIEMLCINLRTVDSCKLQIQNWFPSHCCC